jgi:cytochrome c oxidase accessory protein FixG
VIKHGVFALLSLLLGHVFLAYFVGVERLVTWISRSPLEHPGGFLVVGVTALLVFANFGYFREQLCTIACPYARLQSALLDPRSLIIGYDRARGEPRGRGDGSGDCVDCGACVVACPTGIDIRDGLQLECIACAQCVDACDSVMTKFRRPTGLVRYASAWQLDSIKGSLPPRRVRVTSYALLLGALTIALVASGRHSQQPEVTLLRGAGAPFTVQGERVQNQIRIKIDNPRDVPLRYAIELQGAPGAELIAPENPLAVAPRSRAESSVFVTAPSARFSNGQLSVQLVLREESGATQARDYRLLGPAGGGL